MTFTFPFYCLVLITAFTLLTCLDQILHYQPNQHGRHKGKLVMSITSWKRFFHLRATCALQPIVH